MFGVALAAGMVTGAAGCDKRAQGEAPVQLQTSLAGKPTALFLLFGDREDPRLLPVATIGHGHVTPITLDPAGWRKFDQLYFRAGAEMPIYRNGLSIGNAVVRRGMWEGNEPLYKLPGCHALRPLAAATLSALPDGMATLELLGTSDAMPAAPDRPSIPPFALDTARALATRVAQREGLTAIARSELQLTVDAVSTGVSAKPTLVASYMEKGAGAGLHPRHLFMLADSAGLGAYAPSYVHTANDSTPEFRRLIDHVDISGDGVDEIVLEGWRTGGDTYLLVMKYANGKWREIARGANNWCADPTPP